MLQIYRTDITSICYKRRQIVITDAEMNALKALKTGAEKRQYMADEILLRLTDSDRDAMTDWLADRDFAAVLAEKDEP